LPEPTDTTTPADASRRGAGALGLVVISRERLEAVVDEAVARGRISCADAAELVAALLAQGRSQADDLLAELEEIARGGPADAVRRVTGLRPQPPLAGYDDLTAAEIVRELDGMGEPELRRVRGYERANANRKSVLSVVEARLG
jgi:hypothetical protein